MDKPWPVAPHIWRKIDALRDSPHGTGNTARTPIIKPNRQREGERGSLAHLALDPDPSTMQLHELLGQGQAEPRALLLAGVLTPHLAELLEDRRLILGRDPDSGVADGDGDHAIGRRDGEADSAPLRGELHGIGQEVQQDLLHLPLVRDNVADLRVDMLSERDPVPGCTLPHQGQRVVQGRGQMELPQFQLEPAGLHLGQVENVVD
jgi:hypothetical protein